VGTIVRQAAASKVLMSITRLIVDLPRRPAPEEDIGVHYARRAAGQTEYGLSFHRCDRHRRINFVSKFNQESVTFFGSTKKNSTAQGHFFALV